MVRISNIEDQRSKLYDLVGRKVRIAGKISLPDKRRNPLCFDYRRYLRGKGIYTICQSNQYKITAYEIEKPLAHFLSKEKSRFYDAALEYLNEQDFSQLAGILFGETYYMEDEYYDSYKNNGIAHILAVSGLHVNMAYDVLQKLLKKRKGIISDSICLFAVLCYAALANFSVSVIRASLMILLKTLSFHLCRPYDSLSAAAISASILLGFNPFLIYDSGMQLSFCAAFTMSIFVPWLQSKLKVLSDKIRSERFYAFFKGFIPSFAAFIGLSPLCCFHFLSFNPLNIILNPLVIMLSAWILPVALAGFLSFVLLPSFFASYVLFIDFSALSIGFKTMDMINKLGQLLWENTSVCAPPLGLLILFYIFFFFYFSEGRYCFHRKGDYTGLCAVCFLLLGAGIMIPWAMKITDSPLFWTYSSSAVTFVDVGQGDCIHIKLGGYNILIDGGGNYSKNIGEETLKPYLLKNGIDHIDLAIISHDDMDHSKGIYELNEIYEIRSIVSNTDIYGDTDLSENDSCLISSVNIKGLIFLFMSDADMKREEELLFDYPDLHCDIIKIGHHGSADSSGEDFIDRVAPSFAVISVGKNNGYGHPSERVIELLEDSGIIYGRTDQWGGIHLRRVKKDCFIFENAAKDKRWFIKIKDRQNILQEQ